MGNVFFSSAVRSGVCAACWACVRSLTIALLHGVGRPLHEVGWLAGRRECGLGAHGGSWTVMSSACLPAFWAVERETTKQHACLLAAGAAAAFCLLLSCSCSVAPVIQLRESVSQLICSLQRGHMLCLPWRVHPSHLWFESGSARQGGVSSGPMRRHAGVGLGWSAGLVGGQML